MNVLFWGCLVRPKVHKTEIASKHLGEAVTGFTCDAMPIDVGETKDTRDRRSTSPKWIRVRKTEGPQNRDWNRDKDKS